MNISVPDLCCCGPASACCSVGAKTVCFSCKIMIDNVLHECFKFINDNFVVYSQGSEPCRKIFFSGEFGVAAGRHSFPFAKVWMFF